MYEILVFIAKFIVIGISIISIIAIYSSTYKVVERRINRRDDD